MRTIEREIEHYLTLLRNKIRERGFTQLEVQETLGWGRSYISQLLTKQKTLRLEQVLLILNVIGVDPATFFAELYVDSQNSESFRLRPRTGRQSITLDAASNSENLVDQLKRMRLLLFGLTKLLREKKLITAEGLSEAVREAREESG